MSLNLKKSPLATAQGLGSAKDGTGHWWGQRVSAVLMIPLVIFLLISYMGLESIDHITITSWLKQPLISAAMIMFVLCMFFHSETGVQVVIEDYIHGKTKVVSMLLSKFAHIIFALIAVVSILKISLS